MATTKDDCQFNKALLSASRYYREYQALIQNGDKIHGLKKTELHYTSGQAIIHQGEVMCRMGRNEKRQVLDDSDEETDDYRGGDVLCGKLFRDKGALKQHIEHGHGYKEHSQDYFGVSEKAKKGGRNQPKDKLQVGHDFYKELINNHKEFLDAEDSDNDEQMTIKPTPAKKPTTKKSKRVEPETLSPPPTSRSVTPLLIEVPLHEKGQFKGLVNATEMLKDFVEEKPGGYPCKVCKAHSRKRCSPFRSQCISSRFFGLEKGEHVHWACEGGSKKVIEDYYFPGGEGEEGEEAEDEDE